MDVYMRQKWKDARLKHKYKKNGKAKKLRLPASSTSKIWLVDLFFSNEKSSYFHNIMVPNQYITIDQDGTVFYSARFLVLSFLSFLVSLVSETSFRFALATNFTSIVLRHAERAKIHGTPRWGFPATLVRFP